MWLPLTMGKGVIKLWSGLRVVLVVLLFAWSWMVILPARKMPLFYLALGATEFGHWLALGSLLLTVGGPRRRWPDRASMVMGLAATVLFVSSGVRASWLARSLPGEFNRAFSLLGGPPVRNQPEPFGWSRLWERDVVPPKPVETWQFAEPAGEPLRLDFYRSGTRDHAPCVIMVHGGGWDSGERGEFSEFNHFLAARGYAVAALDYRLAPNAPWPAQREDVGAALEYLRAHASELGVDPRDRADRALGGRRVGGGGQLREAGSGGERLHCAVCPGGSELRLPVRRSRRHPQFAATAQRLSGRHPHGSGGKLRSCVSDLAGSGADGAHPVDPWSARRTLLVSPK